MAIVSAIAPDGISQSTVDIPDALWETAQTELRRIAFNRGYQLDVLNYTPPSESPYAVERTCDDLASCREWIATLNPDED
jgi:hypothetical protein